MAYEFNQDLFDQYVASNPGLLDGLAQLNSYAGQEALGGGSLTVGQAAVNPYYNPEPQAIAPLSGRAVTRSGGNADALQSLLSDVAELNANTPDIRRGSQEEQEYNAQVQEIINNSGVNTNVVDNGKTYNLNVGALTDAFRAPRTDSAGQFGTTDQSFGFGDGVRAATTAALAAGTGVGLGALAGGGAVGGAIGGGASSAVSGALNGGIDGGDVLIGALTGGLLGGAGDYLQGNGFFGNAQQANVAPIPGSGTFIPSEIAENAGGNWYGSVADYGSGLTPAQAAIAAATGNASPNISTVNAGMSSADPNVIWNLSGDSVGAAESLGSGLPDFGGSIVGAIFGNEFGVRDNPTVQGGLNGMIVGTDINGQPIFSPDQELSGGTRTSTEEAGGGGGGNPQPTDSGGSQGGSTAQGGGNNNSGINDVDETDNVPMVLGTYVGNGQMETLDGKIVPVEGNYEVGESVTEHNAQEDETDPDLIVGDLGELDSENVGDLESPWIVYGDDLEGIDPRTGEPYLEPTEESDNGGLSLGGVVGTGTVGSGTGSNGSGEGTNGTGSGEGGDGDGNGEGGNSDGIFGGGTASNDESGLFPYSGYAPSRAAQLGTMMDYVAALRNYR